MWDLPVHGGVEGIGLDASGLSIDTDDSSNSENVSVLNTAFDVPKSGIVPVTFIYQVICVCFVSHGHNGCQLVLVH